MKLLLRKILNSAVVTEAGAPTADKDVEVVGRAIRDEARKQFGRSLHIREVDPGSCNGCELEIGGLQCPYYDLERFGLQFVASPRHADCLLVTGPVTRNMADPLKRTYDATPDPKIVVAVGDCAKNCGIFAGGYGVVGPVSAVIPVDVVVPGCPPNPRAILSGILQALASRNPSAGAGGAQGRQAIAVNREARGRQAAAVNKVSPIVLNPEHKGSVR